MEAEVIAVGSEILAGHTRDTNFVTIATAFAREGIALVRHTIVPDDRDALGEVLRAALARSPLVIVTGGLGATPDDVTRRVMATALGRKLIFREPLLDALRKKYAARGVAMNPASEAMALVPAGAQPIENRVGIAPGLLLRTEQSVLISLPGVPGEMERMLVDEVIPLLRSEGVAGRLRSETLRTVGVSETTLAEWVRPLLGEGVQCAYLPGAGRVDLRLWVREAEREEGALRATAQRLSERLGPALYARGDATLEKAVVSLLAQRGLRIAVAESLTGGRIGAALTDVPGSSAVFQGSIVAYANDAKRDLLGVAESTLRQHGAVSGPVAEAMAHGARVALGADLAISATGIAGPAGGTPEKPVGLVHFGMSEARFARSLRYQMGGSRAMIQERCVTVALNMLRLYTIERLDLLWD
jgi:nicotinamide-nucleotide amidase